VLQSTGVKEMGVLVEAISVVVRRDAINTKHPGGWDAFVINSPNGTLCYDSDIARIGFMHPKAVERYIGQLSQHGFSYLVDGMAQDLVVVDQQRGMMAECDWLEYGQFPFGDSGGKISVCWFYDGPRVAYGTHFPSKSISIATPPGWEFERSLSHHFDFVPNEDEETRLKFLRSQENVDVYFDRKTGKEVYMPRSS
jgi:hypothetical protein